MRTLQFKAQQVFLNYPFDSEFSLFADAMRFAVIAADLIPVCALDLTSPDKPRLEHLIEAIKNCGFSVHDFSRNTGEGNRNFARFSCPIEMGMALFHALETQRRSHRCAFLVPSPNEHAIYASDLAGLDPYCYHGDDTKLVAAVYEWLRSVVPAAFFNSQPIVEVKKKYSSYKRKLLKLNGSGSDRNPTYSERLEVMFQTCAKSGWWNYRKIPAGQAEFPEIPLSWK